MRRLNEDLIIHDTLNPKLFDLNTNKLKPQVRDKIVNIVMEFEDFIDIPIEICDIQLVGSNCSFNWHDGSDVDVHIITDFETSDYNEELLKAYFKVEKSVFNDKYNIKIAGIDVEIYIQDVNEGVTSNGIYSVCDDAWLKEPKPITSIKKYDNSEALGKWKQKIQQVIKNGDKEEIKSTIKMIYLMRHNSIAIDGEYGQGNQLFKELRNQGLIVKLKDALRDAKSKDLSLEGLGKGQLVNRFDDED